MFSIGKVFATGSPRLWLGVCSVFFASLLVGLDAQAQSIVNDNNANDVATGVTSFTVTLPSVSSGNLINIGVGWCGGGTGCGGGSAPSITVTISDSAGNTLTIPSGATITGVQFAATIAQGIVTAASGSTDTFTINFSSAVDYPCASVSQISPPSGYTFSGADGNGTTASGTGSSLSLSLTTSNAEDLLYSFTWAQNFNPGSGQTAINNISADGLSDSYELVTSSGPNSMSYSLSGNSYAESGTMTAFELSSGGGGVQPYGVSPPSGKSWVTTFDDEFTSDSSSIQTTYPPSGSSITTSEGTWTWGSENTSYPEDWNILLNGSSASTIGQTLEILGGNLYLSDDPDSWFIRQSGSWVATSDPNLNAGPVNTTYWNGSSGNTDFCDVTGGVFAQYSSSDTGGVWLFGSPSSTPCGQYYDGLTLSSTNGLVMRATGAYPNQRPSAGIQTGGTSYSNAKFIQKYGYWEASMKMPAHNSGAGTNAHSDFWMHPIPEGISSPNQWCPEIDVAERPIWDSTLEAANTKMAFTVIDCDSSGDYDSSVTTSGYYGASGLPDLSLAFHKYGMQWIDDGSAYGSVQMYIDGTALFSSPHTIVSTDTNMANGIYMFLSLDNPYDNTYAVEGAYDETFDIQYVRVWQAE